MPMMHQSRFLAALELGSTERPPAGLQYAMWCLAASLSPGYEKFCDLFYARARKYSEAAELHVSFTLLIWNDVLRGGGSSNK